MANPTLCVVGYVFHLSQGVTVVAWRMVRHRCAIHIPGDIKIVSAWVEISFLAGTATLRFETVYSGNSSYSSAWISPFRLFRMLTVMGRLM